MTVANHVHVYTTTSYTNYTRFNYNDQRGTRNYKILSNMHESIQAERKHVHCAL